MQLSMQENNELPTYSPEEIEQLIAMCEEQQTQIESLLTEKEQLHRQIQTISSDERKLSAELQSAVQDLQRMKVENRNLQLKVYQLEQQSSEDEQLLLVQQLTAELERANSTNQKLSQQVQQLTEQNVMQSESDLQLKNAAELKRSAEEEKKSTELQRKKNENTERALNERGISADRRERAVSEREKNITEKEKDVQAKADKRIKDEKERIQEWESNRADREIESFRNRFIGIFIVICLICGAQLVLNAVNPVDFTVLQSRWELLLDLFRSIPTWSYQRMGITAAVALVVLIFFGYQYFKRFRDEFTLFAILADLTIIEYAAPLIVDSGFPLWAAFGIIQIVYVIIRDWNDDSSGIRWFLDTMSGNR